MLRHYYHGLISLELLARRDDEGCTPEEMAEVQARFKAVENTASEKELEELYQALLQLQPRAPRPYEPSDLDGIRAARPMGPRLQPHGQSDLDLLERITGGWLGRAAGCALGKPVEGWRRPAIEAYLQLCGETDVTDYFPYIAEQPDSLPRKIESFRQRSCRGQIQYMERDDDTDYTVIGLHVLQSKGLSFTTRDVGSVWLEKLPYHCTYTAERIAYKNLVEGRTPPETAYYRNPCRQWIGAQIRADAFGYACPGWPEKAAELAWRDAALSHVRNGIYGEMWVAAALAAAFTTTDINDVIEVATTEIPTESRFTAMVRQVQAWHRENAEWQGCWERINAAYGHYDGVHTLPNAAVVVMSLLYGAKDFGRTIGIAVQSGWDTDCNGATAGSILGVLLGRGGIPDRWVSPFHNILETAVFGYNYPKFTDLANQTLRVAKQVMEEAPALMEPCGEESEPHNLAH